MTEEKEIWDEDIYYAGTVEVDMDEWEEPAPLCFDDFDLESSEEVSMDESVRFSAYSNERNITEDEENNYS